MSRTLFYLLVASILSACSTIGGILSTEPSSVEIISTQAPATVYVAPTLPPAYTLTPTTTITPTSAPSPTPFQVVTVKVTQGAEETVAPTATPSLLLIQWELFESNRHGVELQVPPQLNAREFGQNILIGDADLDESLTPLYMEIRFDQAGSYRLPEGIDATNARNVLEAVVRELEETYTEVQLVRPIQDVDFNGTPASEVAARASLMTDTTETNLNWYLAVAIQEETVVRFYASSPASAGVTYISVAERIADSFRFIE